MVGPVGEVLRLIRAIPAGIVSAGFLKRSLLSWRLVVLISRSFLISEKLLKGKMIEGE